MKWEYMILELGWNKNQLIVIATNHQHVDKKTETFIEALNQLGNEGWEAVGKVFADAIVLLKRPKS